MGTHTFEIEALLLVLPTTEYQKRVPAAIGMTITDVAVDFINKNNPGSMSKSWKVVCCATQSRRLVQAQPSKKGSIKTTKPATLPPFSTTIIKGSTKLRSQDMRLNLIAEASKSTHLPPSVQCAPTYCTLEPGSSRVAVGLRNIASKSITIPLRTVVGQLQQAKMVPQIQNAQAKDQGKQYPNGGKEGSWVLDQLNLEGLNAWTADHQQAAKDLLVDSADVFSKDDLELGRCNILKCNIKITDPQPFKKGIGEYHPTCMRRLRFISKRWWRWVQSGGVSWASAVVLVRKKDGGLRFCIDLRRLNNRAIEDGYSIPHIEDTLDCLHGAVWFSTLDLKSG